MRTCREAPSAHASAAKILVNLPFYKSRTNCRRTKRRALKRRWKFNLLHVRPASPGFPRARGNTGKKSPTVCSRGWTRVIEYRAAWDASTTGRRNSTSLPARGKRGKRQPRKKSHRGKCRWWDTRNVVVLRSLTADRSSARLKWELAKIQAYRAPIYRINLISDQAVSAVSIPAD